MYGRNLDITSTASESGSPTFFASRAYWRHNPSDGAIRVPKQRVDWLVTTVWVGAVLFSLAWWGVIVYGFIRALKGHS